jgi:hypothetical protein
VTLIEGRTDVWSSMVHGGRRACFFADCTVFSPTKTLPSIPFTNDWAEVNGWTMSPHDSKGFYSLLGKQNGYSEDGSWNMSVCLRILSRNQGYCFS